MTREKARKLEYSSTIPNRLDVHLGSRIRQERIRLGMSVDYVAERLDVANAEIEKYESGRQHICGWDLYKISIILGVSILYLFADNQEKNINSKDNIDILKNRIESIFNRKSDNGDRDHIVADDEAELIRSFAMIDDQNVRNSFVQLLKSFINYNAKSDYIKNDEIMLS
ncbi:helix-turn-helix domain-containing protein [Acidiphilium sp.]|uniref:helix-turn-helix domain-containing protein n=1 Tax=Acidiphilium sp. TaxID=527 RepID=UPI003D003E4D